MLHKLMADKELSKKLVGFFIQNHLTRAYLVRAGDDYPLCMPPLQQGEQEIGARRCGSERPAPGHDI